jgi:hypothetical protein
MIVQCAECKKDVSSSATACPHCGYSAKAVTIEQTGKEYKGAILLFMIGIAVGFFVIIGGAPETGATIALISVVGYVFARIGAWWSHG